MKIVKGYGIRAVAFCFCCSKNAPPPIVGLDLIIF